jgi:hypothetical protein
LFQVDLADREVPEGRVALVALVVRDHLEALMVREVPEDRVALVVRVQDYHQIIFY